MSYDYELGGGNFNRQKWNDKVAQYFKANSEQFVPITWYGGMPVNDPKELSGSGLDGTQCWALPKNGIRGVRILSDSDGVTLALATLASRADFALVEELLKLGVDSSKSGTGVLV